MKLETRHVVLGCAGVAFFGVLILVMVALAVHRLADRFGDSGDWMSSMLPAPPVPSGDARPRGRADYRWIVRDLDGRTLDLRELRGEVVFLNFWATWCGPCVAEMPSIQRLHDQIAGDGVRFVVVSDEDPETVRRFRREKGFTFPIYIRDGALPGIFSVSAIPTTFVLDRNDQVVFRHSGSARWDADTSVAFLRRLL